jgi:hypothetical protein
VFLTPGELVELTGYKRASLQVGWLRKMGVRHYVRRDGRPVVVAADLASKGQDREPTRPDFSKLASAR